MNKHIIIYGHAWNPNTRVHNSLNTLMHKSEHGAYFVELDMGMHAIEHKHGWN
jgi:hypothetical protein